MENLTLNDLDSINPVICCCNTCSGITGLWGAGRYLHVPDMLVLDYASLRQYRGMKISMCSCRKEEAELRQVWEKLPVVEDSGWSPRLDERFPNRGIVDYGRTISFSRKLTSEELDVACRWLRIVKCPGWTGVKTSGFGYSYAGGKAVFLYFFTTTCDSSD